MYRGCLSWFILIIALACCSAVCSADSNVTWGEVSSAIDDLHGYEPTPNTKQNIKNYVEKSNSIQARTGLKILRQRSLTAKKKVAQRAAQSLKVDGKTGDWQGANLVHQDDLHDLLQINPSLPLGNYRAQNDIIRFGFISDYDVIFTAFGIEKPWEHY
jgi:hypothetical protein